MAHYADRISINELKHPHIIKTMPKNKLKILAIDPGTREMGVAFLDGEKLIYHGVKVIPSDKSPNERLKEGKNIILRLINDFKPDILVVEKSFFANNRTASLLHTFINEIRVIGNKKGLKVMSYATSTVRKTIAGNGRASKKELSKVIVSRYPNLKVYLSQDRAWKELYHQNMFDAIALGLMALSNKSK